MQTTNTQFALRLLMNAYATDGKINIAHFLENLQEQAVAAFRDNGELVNDDQTLILNSDIPNTLLLESIADIAYAAGAAGYTSGDSRADMQEFIYLANKFEDSTSDVDWNDETINWDYMEAIDQFITANLKFKKKLGFEYPQGLVAEWDNLEVHPCKQDDDNTVYVLDDDSEEPDFWTVYVHRVEGGVMAIADLSTEKHANDLAELINNAVISFKDNGYMALTRNKEVYDKINIYIDDQMANSTALQRSGYKGIKNYFNDLIKP